MRYKALIVFLNTVLLLSCMKDETIILNISNIEEQIATSTPTLPKVKDEQDHNISKAVNWIVKMQSANGLLESSENTNFVSLYDNALAALVFIELNEIEGAEKIFDYFNGQVNNELLSEDGGFYQFRDSQGNNASRTWIGDNSWLLIALNKYHSVTGNERYKTMANGIEQWLRGQQDSDGGLWGGLNENGTVIPKVTEGMITAFNAVPGYDDFHQNILSFLKENRWDATHKILWAWPENPAYNHALDLHSIGHLIFEDYSPQNLLQADRFYTTQMSTVNGLEVSGYCFDEDKDVVWLEGTAQMAVAHKMSGNDFFANELLVELEKSFINSATISDSKGIPYTSNNGTSYGSDQLWHHADLTPTLSSTAWYIFAKTGVNPLALGQDKEIPSLDSFWITETTSD
ncbi:MAG: hypothetical protein KJO52_02870 [Maribacter sp.]|nr:hypothetical protein [Maribacter sp.]